MQTRRARPSDLPQILKCIRALSCFHGDSATITLEQLQRAFFDPGAGSTALVACQGDSVIGYAGLNHTMTLHSGVPRIDIHHLYVSETHRSRGVGRALIALAQQVGQQRGCLGLTIGTASENAIAQAAYRAMGLEEITDAGPRFWIPVDQ